MTFTEKQPSAGEVILHCGHIDQEAGPHEWSRWEGEPMRFTRPDGTTGKAHWFAECRACFQERNFGDNLMVRGDGIWLGDEPIIKVMPFSGLSI